jgi:hypothetical protein
MTNGTPQVIPVPKPAGRPNKARKINTLLEHQVRRLREIERGHVPMHQTGLAVDPQNMTEGEAAEYIRRMTAKLHELGKKPKRTRKRAAKPKAAEDSETKRA